MATRTSVSPPTLVNIQNAIAGVGFGGVPLVAGDTLKIPAGSASWSDQLDVDIGISIIGATTVDSTIGGLPNGSPYPTGTDPTANDLTIITRDSLNGGHTIVINSTAAT